MVQMFHIGPSKKDVRRQLLGDALGKGLGEIGNTYFANKALEKVIADRSLDDAPTSERLGRLEAALRPFGEKGKELIESRMGIEQQIAKEKQSKIFNKLSSGQQLTEREAMQLPPELQLAYAKATKPTKPLGGLAGQPVPPEIAQAIPPILNANKESSADELLEAFDAAGIPRTYTNSYVENRRREQERTSDKDLKIHELSKEDDKDITSKAKIAKKQLESVKDIREALSTGKVHPGTVSAVFKGFGEIGDKISKAFKNAEEGKFESVVPALIEGWKDIFGVRITDADLKIIESKLPDIAKSPEANEAILKVIEKYATPVILRDEIGKQIKKENKGFRPLNYSDLIEERLSERMKTEKENELPDAKQFEGKKITNKVTGEQMISRNGKWEPI